MTLRWTRSTTDRLRFPADGDYHCTRLHATLGTAAGRGDQTRKIVGQRSCDERIAGRTIMAEDQAARAGAARGLGERIGQIDGWQAAPFEGLEQGCMGL